MAVGVLHGEAAHPQADVGLLGLLVADGAEGAVAVDGGEPGGRRARRPVAPVGGHQLLHLGGIDVAGDSYHQVVGHVLAAEVLEGHLAADGLHRLLAAGDVPAQGLVGPEGLVEEEVGHLAGVVGDHRQLFEDDLPLLLHLLGLEDGRAHHVGQHVQGEGEVGRRHLAVVDRELAVGAAVEEAAHAVDGLGDLAGGGPLGAALEAEVLDEVGEAGLLLALVAGARPHVDTDAHRVGVGHGGGEDAEAVGQCRFFVGEGHFRGENSLFHCKAGRIL